MNAPVIFSAPVTAPVCISQFAVPDNRPLEHRDVLDLPRANEEVASLALELMREQLHRSGPASRWDRLPLDARRMICFAARLRPSDYASRDLDEMSMDEREAIRRAVLAMKTAAAVFAEGLLTQRDWMMVPNREAVSEAARQRETARRIELERQRKILQARFDSIQK